MASRILALSEKLESKGWSLHHAISLVDGEQIIVMDWSEVDGLVKDYEDQIAALESNIAKLRRGR